MQIHADTHLDHGLSEYVVAHIVDRFNDRSAFFIETFELPTELGKVDCALYGPAMGDAPVVDAEVTAETRGDRGYKSRCIAMPARQTSTVTVIAGPHAGLPMVLYTAFGGPQAPKEVGELEQAWEAVAARSPRTDEDCVAMDALRVKLEESRAFWRDHALAR